MFDDSEDGDGDRNIVLKLMRLWQDERHAPDLLLFQGDVVERALQLLSDQGDLVTRLQTREDTSEEEHFKMMLVRTEMERVKFVIRSYLRTRLYKIERYAPYVLSTPEIQPRLSAMELAHAAKYGTLIASQFNSAVLAHVPESLRTLDDDDMHYTPAIVTKPNLDLGVFVHARANCPNIRMSDGNTVEIHKDDLQLLRYRSVEDALRRGLVELV
ncbi:GINS complex, Sld5 component [Exidia glandulosa HHB12029]|uniref:DNA replication complex GINS protein SLD5 n=1 Tax=Exidia glandulosa HHB12029 TaxID=1314781 RepID=A0A165DGX7_EXIGL|nr:GINS complex, Sld5 component [Exidia glandulosa HHB12029]